MNKEKEKRERTKESKVKEKDTSFSPTRAREDYEALYQNAILAIKLGGGHQFTPPKPSHVITFATSILGATEEFALNWYKDMTQQGWRDLNNQPIKNWQFMMRAWLNGLAYFSAKQELLAARTVEMRSAAKRGTSPKCSSRPINYRGTRKEDMEYVLG